MVFHLGETSGYYVVNEQPAISPSSPDSALAGELHFHDFLHPLDSYASRKDLKITQQEAL